MSRVLVRIFGAKITGVMAMRWSGKLGRRVLGKWRDFGGFLAVGAGDRPGSVFSDFVDFREREGKNRGG